MRAVIFANGDVEDLDAAMAEIQPGDLIIAADGGLRHVLRLGLTPSVLIGDLDSAPGELVQVVTGRGAEILRHDPRKDKTDLELALDLAHDRGAGEVVVFGGLGGRLDHALANVLLLSGHGRNNVRFTGGGYEVMVVAGEVTIHGQIGNLVTLLALREGASGVTTKGLEYCLDQEDLEQGSSRGVSNVMTAESATISVTGGRILAIHLTEEDD